MHFIWPILFNSTNTRYTSFFSVPNMREKQQRSGKIRLQKRLFYDKQLAKNVTSSFLVLSLSQFQKDF